MGTGGFDESAVAGIYATASRQRAADRSVAIGPDCDLTAIAGINRIGIDNYAVIE